MIILPVLSTKQTFSILPTQKLQREPWNHESEIAILRTIIINSVTELQRFPLHFDAGPW